MIFLKSQKYLVHLLVGKPAVMIGQVVEVLGGISYGSFINIIKISIQGRFHKVVVEFIVDKHTTDFFDDKTAR